MSKFSELDSSTLFPDALESIENSKENLIQIGNTCNYININNKIILNETHIFNQYRDLIFSNLVSIPFPENFYYKPESVSKTLYGTVDLWYLILFVNNMTSVYDFHNKERIVIYNPEKLDVLIKILEKNKNNLKSTHSNPTYLKDLTLKKVIVSK